MISTRTVHDHLATLLFLIGVCSWQSLHVVAAELLPEDAKLVGRMAAESALRYSISGNRDQRDEKLRQALARDPNCELAHWHLGQMRFGDQWLSVDDVEAKLKEDPTYQNYLRRRAALTGDARQELRLATWCRGQGLTDLANFHDGQVLQNAQANDKQREEALVSLGLRKFQGEWLTADEIDRCQSEQEAQSNAARKWDRSVTRWLKWIQRQDDQQLEIVRQQMADIDSLAVIPLLEARMSSVSDVAAMEVIRWLTQHPEIEATESLLRHATDAPWPGAKQAAIEALKERPIHDVVPPLLEQLVPPVESRYCVHVSPMGVVKRQHEFYRAGEQVNDFSSQTQIDSAIRPGRAYGVVRGRDVGSRLPWSGANLFLSDGGSAASGRIPTVNEQLEEQAKLRLRTELLAAKAALQGAAIERDVQKMNQSIVVLNRRIYPVLQETTQAQVADQPEAWWDYWESYNEQYSPPKTTRYWYNTDVEYYGSTYLNHAIRMSCFVEGTQVRTDQGLQAIESVEPGSRVLSQNTETGELAYKVVQARTERPGSDVLQIDVGEDSILATKGHPFWVNGKGWRMAKHLVDGDILHTLQGPLTVAAISPQLARPAYNLVIADGNTYFVGKSGVLVHDNKPRQPSLALVPGLVTN